MTENKQIEKSPVGASFLAMVPSMGHFYAGNMIKGIAYALIFVFLLMMVINGRGDEVVPFALGLGGFYIFQIIDAYNEAKKASGRKRAMTETDGETNEEESSLTMGIIILGLGIVFQLYALDLISFSIIGKFWPIFLVGFGGKLIYSYIKNNNEKKENPGTSGYETKENNGGTNE
jgi:hypothetical protein